MITLPTRDRAVILAAGLGTRLADGRPVPKPHARSRHGADVALDERSSVVATATWIDFDTSEAHAEAERLITAGKLD